jgi:hypothetical protein
MHRKAARVFTGMRIRGECLVGEDRQVAGEGQNFA